MKNEFRIDMSGLDEFYELLNNMDRKTKKIIKEEMTEYGMLVEEGAKALAPHEHGDLEESINFDKAKVEGDSIVVRGGSNLDYAMRRHEAPYSDSIRGKDGDESFYIDGRGRGTRGKPSWRGYEPGRKYLENAVRATEDDYQEMNRRAINRIIGDA